MKLPERFILIDDDPFNNKLCKNILNKIYKNIEVIGFTEPEKGIDYILNEYSENPVYTVLFLDINMPTLNGWQVVEKISHMSDNICMNIVIFILSSSIHLVDKTKASENPIISGYIEKPLNIKRLESIFI